MITAYSPAAADFSTLGLGALTPRSCSVTEVAGGMYELSLEHDINAEMRDSLITQYGIIKAPAPVRENPETEDSAGTVTRALYRTTKSVKLYNKVGGKALRNVPQGAVFAQLKVVGANAYGLLVKGGVRGWIASSALTFYRTQTETVGTDTPGDIIKPVQSREQLFRVCEITRDSGARTLTARALHITYDLAGYVVQGALTFKNVTAKSAVAQIIANLDHVLDDDWQITCESTARISGDFGGKNLLQCLLDPDEGIAALAKLRVVRDNYCVYLLDYADRDRGVAIRYGKNLLSAAYTEDSSNVVTRILPVGKNKKGEDLYASAVVSSREAASPVKRTVRREYDVTTGQDGITTDAAARTKLRELAQADFDAGADLPGVSLSAEFIRLELTPKYRELADAYALHLYDTVPVTDEGCGISASVRMTGYTYNCLLDRYEETTLGDLTDIGGTVYGYELASGSVSGVKLMSGSVDGGKLRSLSVQYAKIAAAAIEQLNADSITANSAYIEQLAAGTVTAETLKAAYADIIGAHIEDLTAGSISTDRLAAALAQFTVITAGEATFDKATVKHLIASALQVEDAVGEDVYIKNLAVDYASMVNAYVGNLCVKGEDGKYYKLTVGSDGSVTPVETEVTDSESETGQLTSGEPIIESKLTVSELTATDIKSVYALISRIDASRIDVGTLTATDAYIAHLQTADISANTSIRTSVKAGNDVARYMTFDDTEGLTQRVPGKVYYTRITQNGYEVRSDLEAEPIAAMTAADGLTAPRLTMGGITCKRTGSGGWSWQERES